ncbi:hypothetical protein K523DRAFT_167881 [Schizophyllum commune Tattone D]|nr:hypothetical protein K523DRAFT_167881 [Schizophyllum commune Tattone D]
MSESRWESILAQSGTELHHEHAGDMGDALGATREGGKCEGGRTSEGVGSGQAAAPSMPIALYKITPISGLQPTPPPRRTRRRQAGERAGCATARRAGPNKAPLSPPAPSDHV